MLTLVFRCWSCTKGWFDLGGPAWRALTGGAPPGHVHGVRSTWVTCPGELARGNIQVYVKPGSDPWDARFQVIYNTACNFCQLDIITKDYLLNIYFKNIHFKLIAHFTWLVTRLTLKS